MTLRILSVALACAALAGCAMTPSAPPSTAPTGDTGITPEQWVQRQGAYEAWSAARPGWTATASGLQYRKLRGRAVGPHPLPTDIVTIHYVGRLIDGRAFDSSRERGEPATFPLPQLIQGWQEGVPLMRVGETFEFVIPASLAYGERSPPPIPPGSTLLFEIELIGASAGGPG